MADALAIRGGPATVSSPPPHFRWPVLGPEEEAAVLAQLRDGVSLARSTGVIAAVERAFSDELDLPYAMSTCSGTAALHAAYFALDLEPGDEVLAPAYTHLATVLPMLHVRLVPVLCDIDPRTGNLDVAEAASRITSRTRAIAVTHQYGHVCDMRAIVALARRHGLRIVEDCSHAHGSSRDGRPAGTFGDVACFSLQAHKAVAAGEGGMLVTRDPRLFERAAMFGHFRQRTPACADYGELVETGYGLKNRLHPLAAALALVGMRKLPAVIEARRANLAYFAAELADVPGIEPLPTEPGCDRGGWFRFLVHYRLGVPIERYLDALRAEGVVEVMPGSAARPLHLLAIFQTRDDRMIRDAPARPVYRRGDFPNAERFSAMTLQFPAFTEPCRELLAQYAAAMRKVARHALELA